MRKTLIAVLVLTLGTTLAVAGHGGKHSKGMKQGVWSEKLSEKLNLSESQRQQIRDLETSFRQQNEPLFTSYRENKRAYGEAKKAGDTARADSLKATLTSQKAQLTELHENQEQRILSVLTSEQRAQFEALKAERGMHKRHQ